MKRRGVVVAVVLLSSLVPLSAIRDAVVAVPNPVATDEAAYQAFGRVFPDPHGCLAAGVPDINGDGIKDTPRGVSPWAKGRVCADQFLQYQEVIEGATFLQSRFPEFLRVIRLDQAYDNSDYMSAGIPRMVVLEDGTPKIIGRDRRPLYLFKVTDSTSPIPEKQREHFVYTLSIHGIERAGLEGGIRAMEDLVTWAACELPKYAQLDTTVTPPRLPAPACATEGPFPKKIVETPTTAAVPTAGEVLDKSVIYFLAPNPDGWARGQVAPVEVEDGSPNLNYTPGFYFQRYNGDGVDLNRDWPTIGYTFKPYSPASEPEVKAYRDVLKGIRNTTEDGRFSGGIDLHGMVTAYAFSYTLLGSGQRDYRKNALTVDTSIRTWEDQTRRMSWSPYITDANADGAPDQAPAGNRKLCFGSDFPEDPLPDIPNVTGGGTRGHVPACVADQWGTVIDTIGYQVSGSLGDWIDSPLGLDGVGIDNEMYASHLAPNIVFEPALEQTHIDGNKGLIYSQIASLLTAGDTTFTPTGKVGYVYNPKRLQINEAPRPVNPGLPAQNDIDVLLPCQKAAAQNLDAASPCGEGEFKMAPPISTTGLPTAATYEFRVKGPDEGFWNGGLTAQYTAANVAGVGPSNALAMQLQHFHEGQWHTVGYHFRQGVSDAAAVNPGVFLNANDTYQPTGQVVTLNDPQHGPNGRYRIMFQIAGPLPGRLEIDFHPVTAEDSPGQRKIDASSMDFFDELNQYVPQGSKLEQIPVSTVASDRSALRAFDSIILVNDIGSRSFLTGQLGVSSADADSYFANLASFARNGGNLVLTDGALQALPQLGTGILPADVKKGNALAGNYFFDIGGGTVTYRTPGRFPLATDVNKPGAAEQQTGRRQAAEPTPLGYTPDTGYDNTPTMPVWGVTRTAWQGKCGLTDCVTALSDIGGAASLGEMKLGDGRIRFAGVMLPNPVFQPDIHNDHRFGVASYALTYTAYEVFENLINWDNPIDLAVDVTCANCPVAVEGGTPATANLSVANMGTAADTYDLSVASAPEGWTTSVSPGSVPVAPGESATAELTVTPPPAPTPGTYDFEVKATSQRDPEVSDTEKATFEVLERRGVDLSCTQCLIQAQDGGEATANLSLTNTGNVEDDYNVSVADAPEGWAASVSPESVTVASGGEGFADLIVGPKAGTPPGTYEVVVQATSQHDPSATDTQTVEVAVPERRDVGLSCDPNPCRIETRAGRTGTTRLVVANTGNVSGAYDLAVVTQPKDWRTTFNPTQLSLDAGGSGNSTVAVRPRSGAKRGSYQVVIKVTDRGAPSVTDQVTITVVVVKPPDDD